MNAAQATETPNVRLRVATLNDVTCRIEREGKGFYSVYVGDRTKISAHNFNRLKDAKAYVDNRAESDARLKAKAERRAEREAEKARGIHRRIFTPAQRGVEVCRVAQMSVRVVELRCEVDGSRGWEILLDGHTIGYCTEFATERVSMHFGTDFEARNRVGQGNLAEICERFASFTLRAAFYGRG